MYRFEYSGRKYRVRFIHNQDEHNSFLNTKNGKVREFAGTTTCIVEEYLHDDENGKPVWNPIARDRGFRSIKDKTFDRFIGRKAALIRTTRGMDKPFRTAIFQAAFHQ